MRTSLNEIQTIEAYLHGTLSTSDHLVFEARMLISKELRKNVMLQKKVYELIRHHQRLMIKNEFRQIHARLFHAQENSAIKDQILNFFKP